MKLDSESVKVADVQWTKVGVECIVEKGSIDREVEGWLGWCGALHTLWSRLRS